MVRIPKPRVSPVTRLNCLAVIVSAAMLTGEAGVANAASFTFTDQVDWLSGTYTNTNSNEPPVGMVKLNDAILTPFNHIWVALSGRDSVVRIDTNTAAGSYTAAQAGGTAVLGEYLTRPNGRAGNPSRTTVDANGDVWVGNRNEGTGGLGSITKISANPTGTSSTGVWNGSTFNRLDWNNAGGADNNGGVSTAADSAITQYVRTVGANVRHVSIDANNNVWAGGGPLDAGDQVFQLYNGSTGAAVPDPDGAGPQVTSFGDNNTGGYGGLVDGNGVIWSAGLNGNTLTRMDPATGARMTVNQGGRQSYGLGIDNNGFIWNATWTNNTVDKIDPNGNVVGSFNLANFGNSLRGVAVTPDNDIWVAASGSNRVIRVNNDGTIQGFVNVGGTPTGVAVDANGKVWVTNYGSNSVMRIDPATNAVDLSIDLGPGANPYNYSDMTGTVLIGTTIPTGTWRRLIDGGAGVQWADIFWNTEAEGSIPLGTNILIELRAADTEAGLALESFQTYTSGDDISGLTGRILEVRATFTRSGGAGAPTPILSDLTITTQTGPGELPEPGTLLLIASSLMGLAWMRRRNL